MADRLIYVVRIGYVYMRADTIADSDALVRKGGKLLCIDGGKLRPCERKAGSQSLVMVDGRERWA